MGARRIAKLVGLLLAVSGPSFASVIEVSIPFNSQSPFTRPQIDQLWDATAVNGVLDVNTGIGIIINPGPVVQIDALEFGLHQDPLPPSSPYLSAGIPEPTSSTVTYTFDQQTIVSGVEVVQHVNGITQVTGLLGDSLLSMQSLGSVFGPSGNLVDPGCGAGGILPNGISQVFDFGNSTLTGSIFQLTVNRTSCTFAYGAYRIFPLDEDGHRILAINDPSEIPEPGNGGTMVLLAGGLLLFGCVRRIESLKIGRSLA